MKLKYYLRGAGVGVIVAVIIMAIGGANSTMTDAQIIKRAEELGMVKTNATSEKISDQINKDKSQADTPESSQEPEPSQSEPEPSSEAPQSSVAIQDEGDSIKVIIDGGMFSDKVSIRLKEAGLISDADDFNKFLINKGYDNKMIAGEFNIPKGSTYEQIAVILTTKNK